MGQCDICELYDYADEFWEKEIVKIFPILCITERCVPIRITNRVNKREDGIYHHMKNGASLEYKMAIVHINSREKEDVKRTIRHELIHLALDLNHLKNEDDCAAFKFMCDIFDADFYAGLNPLESKIYCFYKKYIEECVQLLSKHNFNTWANLGMMLEVVGSKKICAENLIGNELKKVEVLLSATRTLSKNR